MQSTTFTSKMLSEEVFTCALCKKLLEAPVMIVEDIGNICNTCFTNADNPEEWHAIPNTKMDVVLKELVFPCMFESDGCEYTNFYEQLHNHQTICMYRPINCLLPKTECKWNGKVMELLKHFKDQHPQHILKNSFNKFSFQLDITKTPINVIKLLLNGHEKIFLLKIWESGEERGLMNAIQEIKFSGEGKYVGVKYVGKNSQYKITVDRDPFPTVDNAKKICAAILNEVSDSNTNNITVTVKIETGKVQNMTEAVLKQLECSVCKELMRPPINQCLSGHSFCNSCRQKVTQCPTCRTNWSDVRNYSLEGVTPSVLYPCVYNHVGCEGAFLGNDIDHHERVCEFKIYTCPISDCKFTGNYSLCVNHFFLNHREFLIESTVFQETFTPIASNTMELKYIFEHENMYKFTFQRLASSCNWYVRILNDYDKNRRYYYNITITDAQVQQRKISKSVVCLNKDIAKNSDVGITFSYDDLSTYKKTNNDQINYCCEIRECEV
ncbi:uncharacterized protein LOC123011212 [Tribolium madens]|uniref:uncharacterized protein LOC123011212 n=1 Tax=Tribolium madens TaxID=41895 RepID=UPI001CF725BA|nr:uncharacterized protein LOC123011212 [Tribolium madens]